MIAVDTNVIVRFLTKDDEAQYQKAYRIFAESAQLFIPTTVILETEWVLRFSYRFSSDRIGYALSGVYWDCITSLLNIRPLCLGR